MITSFPSMMRSIGMMALLAILFIIPATLAQAQTEEKVLKQRGNIESIDFETKTLTLKKANGGSVVLVWDDNTKLESTVVTAISEIKPGMYFRCIMVDRSELVGRLRHEPEFDLESGETPAQ